MKRLFKRLLFLAITVLITNVDSFAQNMRHAFLTNNVVQQFEFSPDNNLVACYVPASKEDGSKSVVRTLYIKDLKSNDTKVVFSHENDAELPMSSILGFTNNNELLYLDGDKLMSYNISEATKTEKITLSSSSVISAAAALKEGKLYVQTLDGFYIYNIEDGELIDQHEAEIPIYQYLNIDNSENLVYTLPTKDGTTIMSIDRKIDQPTDITRSFSSLVDNPYIAIEKSNNEYVVAGSNGVYLVDSKSKKAEIILENNNNELGKIEELSLSKDKSMLYLRRLEVSPQVYSMSIKGGSLNAIDVSL